ncbi:MAG: hypothetical protein ACR2KK_19450 [Acidimicrobiales bacterium]
MRPGNGTVGTDAAVSERAVSERGADVTTLVGPAPGPEVVEPDPRPAPEVQRQAAEYDPATTVQHREPLAGLGGGSNGAGPVISDPADPDPFDESIWADPPGLDGDIGLISTSGHPASPVYAAAEGSSEPPWWRRVDVRSGNAAVIGLISLVSVVLLGMFVSVRARNDVPTDSSPTRRPSNDIAATGPVNTIPSPILVTTTAPPPPKPADLPPPADPGAPPAPAPGPGGTGSGGGGSGAPATTAAPRTGGSSGAGSGGGGSGGGGSTTPATQAPSQPATTSAPPPTSPPATSAPPVEDTTPPPTSPPVDNPPQPPPTSRPRPPTTFPSIPSIPTTPTTSNTSFPSIPPFPAIDD